MGLLKVMANFPAESLVFTNSNCIGCNKCIKVCSSTGACISQSVNGKNQIHVDPSKCIACGACLDVCAHNAREYADDTARFFDDLAKGESISILVAPSFEANYPNEFRQILGGLKKLGVNHIINVSFGADITTWAYLNFLSQNDFHGGISNPCPAVVAYIERHIPSLIPKLFPVHSPLICSAIYGKEYLGIKDKFAFISPCIAKKMEIDDPNTEGYVSYNVTFKKLYEEFKSRNLFGEPADDELEYGIGSAYPSLGGLKENISWFLGTEVFVRQVEGEKRMYHYLESNKEKLSANSSLFSCIDALNCSGGCLYGTGCSADMRDNEDILINLLKIKELHKTDDVSSPWCIHATPQERLKNLNTLFGALNPSLFVRRYTNRSSYCQYKIPNENEIDEIFKAMDKYTEEDRSINCSSCGYDSCKDMATAIYNGYNEKTNCIFYIRHKVEEKERLADIAQKANIAKDIFLSNMSHEIRTPLNAVLGMNSMILKESHENSILGYSHNIEQAGKTLLSIINDILDISKIESGQVEIHTAKYSLPELMKDILGLCEPFAKEKGLDFAMTNDGKIPEFLLGDEARIRQITVNLISNAIKYTAKGSVKVNIRSNDVSDDTVNLTVSVIDTGIGIRKKDFHRLFDKFQRLDLSKNRTIEGAGLGLAFCKGYLDYMDGTITADSEYNKGSTFTFTLPQKKCSEHYIDNIFSDEAAVPSETNKQLLAKKCSVLIVDDVPMNLFILSELLKASQIHVATASSGEEALKLTQTEHYDIILMDHMMPDMDGVETMNNIRSQENGANTNTPIIVQTANAMRGTREQYLSSGFVDCLFKPIDPSVLYDTLAIYLPANKIEYK